MDRGRLVLQDSLATLRAPTGRVVLRTPDPEWAVALLDGELGGRFGDRLVVRSDDPAALNARLVRHGIRISELAAERRTLEEVVLAATSAGSDRVDGVGPRPPASRAESTGPSAPGAPTGPDRSGRSDGSDDGSAGSEESAGSPGPVESSGPPGSGATRAGGESP